MKKSCANIETCPYFHHGSKSRTDEIIQKYFCYGTKENCARYHVFSELGKPAVPRDLHPMQMDRAVGIVREHAKPCSEHCPDGSSETG